MLASSTASTFSSRPAANGSSLGDVNLRTELIDPTRSSLILLSLVINVSAMPKPRLSSRLSDPNGLKGNTAIDLIGGFGSGDFDRLPIQVYRTTPIPSIPMKPARTTV